MTNTQIPPSKTALQEALNLSEEILKNIELNELPLTNIALKTSRLARLLNEFGFQKLMEYEAGGYPSTPAGVELEVWELGVLAKRIYKRKEKGEEPKEYMFMESIEKLELQTKTAEASLGAARDPDVALSSANPYQTIMHPVGNKHER